MGLVAPRAFPLSWDVQFRAFGAKPMTFQVRIFVLSAMLLTSCGGQVVETKRSVDRTELAELDGAVVSYFLPRGEFNVKASYDAKSEVLTITHSGVANIFPDVRHRYNAVYRHVETSNDTATIELEPNGLLKQISTTSTDQSREIVKAAVDVVKEFTGLQSAINRNNLKTILESIPAEAPPPAKSNACLDMSASARYDLTYQRGAHHKPAPPPSARKTEAGGTCTLRLSIHAHRAQPLPAAAYAAAAANEPEPIFGCPRSAVCFRTSTGYEMTITATLTRADGTVILGEDSVSLVAPDATSAGVLYFNRRAFVSNSTTASFTNGMLTKLTASDPSAVVGALQLSTDVLKSLTVLVRL